jgi:DNA-binding Lrp family transcriptional regulator
MQKSSLFKPDALDRMLVKELENNARQSIYALSAKLATSPSTVHKRMKRLIKERAITVVALPYTGAFGLKTVAAMGINVSPGRSDAVAEYLESCSGFRNFGIYTGPYDVFFTSFFQDSHKLIDFIDGTLAGAPDITNIETMLALEAVKNSYKLLGDDTGLVQNPTPRDLDQVDLKLISEMVLNPLKSLTELHKILGISRMSAGKKLQSLINDNFLKIVCVANPFAFGFNVTSVIFVQVHPGHAIRTVAGNLASCERLRHITIMSGRFNICCWAIFRDLTEMYEFLRNDLGNISGIMKYESMLQISTSGDFFKKA